MTLRRSSAYICALFAAASIVRVANAEPSEAERLFREGRELMIAERFAEACAQLEQSERLEPSGGTLLNLAACHERLGRIATAWVEFQNGLVWALTDGREGRARLARERIEVLEPRLPWLTLSLAEPAESGVVVTLDGAPIESKALGKEMPVDPGVHRIVATFPDGTATEQRVAMNESQHRTIRIAGSGARRTLDPTPGELRPDAPPIARSAIPPTAASDSSGESFWGAQRVAGVVVGLGGIAALGFGTYFIARSYSHESTAHAYCTGASICSMQGLDFEKQAATEKTTGLILLSTGAAVVAGGIVLYATAPSGAKRDATTGRFRDEPQLAVRAGIGSASIAGAF